MPVAIVSTIDSELESSSIVSTPASANYSSAATLVAEQALTSAQNSVTFANLDSSVDGDYVLEHTCQSAGMGSYLLVTINGDSTYGHYSGVRIFGATGVGADQQANGGAAAGWEAGYIISNTNSVTYSIGSLRISKSVDCVLYEGSYTAFTGAAHEKWVTGGRYNQNVNISSITIAGDGSLFAPGSTFRLFRANCSGSISTVDLTGATSDFKLAPGQAATISYSGVSTVPLRVATEEGQYEISIIGTNPTIDPTVVGITYFLPNNQSGYFGSTFTQKYAYQSGSSIVDYNVDNAAAILIGWTKVYNARFYINTYTSAKSAQIITSASSHASFTLPNMFLLWGCGVFREISMAWTSLGTVSFPEAQSGKIIIRRVDGSSGSGGGGGGGGSLGFTPVQAGSGIGQTADGVNQIFVGWDGVSKLKATVDVTDLGDFVFGTDPRLTDARTPTAHNQTAATITDFSSAALAAAPAETATSLGNLITGSTYTATPVDGDQIALSVAAASPTGKVSRLSWANIKATLKSYFDTLYAAVTHTQAESTITFTDVTTGNASTGQHGYLPKLGGGTSNFLRADGSWALPPSGGGGLGFVPVHAGGGVGQNADGVNQVYVGWNGTYLKATVDTTDIGSFVFGADSRLSDSRTASDVYAWAKASVKPSYTYSEVGAAAASHSQAESSITFTDITTGDATTGQHGYLPKLGGGTSNFLRADGSWAAPAGGSGGDTLTSECTLINSAAVQNYPQPTDYFGITDVYGGSGQLHKMSWQQLHTSPIFLTSMRLDGDFSMTSTTAGLEMGLPSGAGTPYIDFHTSGVNQDYDARILASGGTSGLGLGTITVTAASFGTSGKFGCNGATPPTRTTLNAASTDLTTVIALCNQIRTALQNNGICG